MIKFVIDCMFVLVTLKPQNFEKTAEQLRSQEVSLKVIGEDISGLYKFFRENEHTSIVVIVDTKTISYSAIKEFFSHKHPNIYVVAVVDELKFELIADLFEFEVKRILSFTDCQSGNAGTTLLKILENFQEEQEDVKLRAAIEKQLIVEYNKANSLINSLNFGVLIMTPGIGSIGYVLQDANQEIERLLDFPVLNFLGQPVKDVLHREDIPATIKDIFSVDVESIDQKTSSLVEYFPQGAAAKKYIRRIINPFRDKNNEITGYIWLMLDVSSEVEKGFVDTLTGLFNRRFLQKSIHNEIMRNLQLHQETKFPLCCAMLDIDNFKNINDTFGHSAGDNVIEGIGTVLIKDVLFPNHAIRYGGEEFLIILQNQKPEYCRELCQRISEEVRNLKIIEQKITISIGIAYVDNLKNHSVNEVSISEILKNTIDNADKALYIAKNSGKDRFVEFD